MLEQLEESKRLRDALKRMVSLAKTAFKKWDEGEDHKVGKLLNAMTGGLPGYTADTDFIQTVLEQTKHLDQEAHANIAGN